MCHHRAKIKSPYQSSEFRVAGKAARNHCHPGQKGRNSLGLHARGRHERPANLDGKPVFRHHQRQPLQPFHRPEAGLARLRQQLFDEPPNRPIKLSYPGIVDSGGSSPQGQATLPQVEQAVECEDLPAQMVHRIPERAEFFRRHPTVDFEQRARLVARQRVGWQVDLVRDGGTLPSCVGTMRACGTVTREALPNSARSTLASPCS